jgi:phytoene/squalene synthetase
VFCEGDQIEYQRLKEPARKLGAAFQKVNFLRDMGSDYSDRGRVYFPHIDFTNFNQIQKKLIEEDIQKDFDEAYQGILQLPKTAQLGVYLAYAYYLKLFTRIKQASTDKVLSQRIRIPDNSKLSILIQSYFKHKLNYL